MIVKDHVDQHRLHEAIEDDFPKNELTFLGKSFAISLFSLNRLIKLDLNMVIKDHYMSFGDGLRPV